MTQTVIRQRLSACNNITQFKFGGDRKSSAKGRFGRHNHNFKLLNDVTASLKVSYCRQRQFGHSGDKDTSLDIAENRITSQRLSNEYGKNKNHSAQNQVLRRQKRSVQNSGPFDQCLSCQVQFKGLQSRLEVLQLSREVCDQGQRPCGQVQRSAVKDRCLRSKQKVFKTDLTKFSTSFI